MDEPLERLDRDTATGAEEGSGVITSRTLAKTALASLLLTGAAFAASSAPPPKQTIGQPQTIAKVAPCS